MTKPRKQAVHLKMVPKVQQVVRREVAWSKGDHPVWDNVSWHIRADHVREPLLAKLKKELSR